MLAYLLFIFGILPQLHFVIFIRSTPFMLINSFYMSPGSNRITAAMIPPMVIAMIVRFIAIPQSHLNQPKKQKKNSQP
jgi:hypothetical protein